MTVTEPTISEPAARPATSLGSAALWMALAYAIALSCQLLVGALAGRALGTDEFGAFATVMTIVIVVSQLGLLGQPMNAVRNAAILRDHNDAVVLADTIAAMRTLDRIVLPLLGGVTAIALAAWFARGSLPAALEFTSGVALLVMVGAAQRLHAALLRGYGEVRVAPMLEGRSGGALMLAIQLFAIGVVCLVGTPSLPVFVLVSGIGVLPSVWLSRRLVKRRLPPVRIKWQPVRDLRRTLRTSRGFASLQAGILLDVSVDVALAAAVLSATESSLFAGAQRIAMVIIIPTALAQLALGPLIARSAANLRAAESVIRSAATVTTALGAVCVLPLLLAPSLVMSITYGREFSGGASALAILGIGYLVRVCAGMAVAWLSFSGYGYEKTASRIFAVGFVGRCTVGVIAGITSGLIGFCLASAVITVATFGLLWWAASRTGVRTHATMRPALRDAWSARA